MQENNDEELTCKCSCGKELKEGDEYISFALQRCKIVEGTIEVQSDIELSACCKKCWEETNLTLKQNLNQLIGL